MVQTQSETNSSNYIGCQRAADVYDYLIKAGPIFGQPIQLGALLIVGYKEFNFGLEEEDKLREQCIALLAHCGVTSDGYRGLDRFADMLRSWNVRPVRKFELPNEDELEATLAYARDVDVEPQAPNAEKAEKFAAVLFSLLQSRGLQGEMLLQGTTVIDEQDVEYHFQGLPFDRDTATKLVALSGNEGLINHIDALNNLFEQFEFKPIAPELLFMGQPFAQERTRNAYLALCEHGLDKGFMRFSNAICGQAKPEAFIGAEQDKTALLKILAGLGNSDEVYKLNHKFSELLVQWGYGPLNNAELQATEVDYLYQQPADKASQIFDLLKEFDLSEGISLNGEVIKFADGEQFTFTGSYGDSINVIKIINTRDFFNKSDLKSFFESLVQIITSWSPAKLGFKEIKVKEESECDNEGNEENAESEESNEIKSELEAATQVAGMGESEKN